MTKATRCPYCGTETVYPSTLEDLLTVPELLVAAMVMWREVRCAVGIGRLRRLSPAPAGRSKPGRSDTAGGGEVDAWG